MDGTDRTHFTYVIYIATTPEELWNALIDRTKTEQYWQRENLSDWKPGSRWEHRRSEDTQLEMVGRVIEVDRPRRLALTWATPGDEKRAERHSRVTIEIEPVRGIMRLSVHHERLRDESMHQSIVDGWPKVLSSLKSLLERGEALPKLW